MKPDADSCNFNNCGTDRMLASKLGSFKLANEARQDLISKSDNVQGQASWNSPQVRVPDHPHREVNFNQIIKNYFYQLFEMNNIR